MRVAVTILVVLLALVLSPLGATPAQSMVDPQPSADPEYIESGGTTQLYGPDWVWYPLMGGEWVLVEDWHWSDDGAGGAFWPSADIQNPLWTGPGNHTGSGVLYELECTVTAFSYSEACTLDIFEITDPHYVAVTASASPTTVESGGTASLSGSATCTEGHPIVSWYWSADVSGGSFEPSSYTQSPDYIAPSNTGSSNLTVTLTLTAECQQSISGQDTITLSVQPIGHAIELTASCDPPAVSYGETTQCSAAFVDSEGHSAASWLWDDGGAGGTFLPSADVQNPSYQAPSEGPASQDSIVLTVTVECDGPSPVTASDSVELGLGHVSPFSDVPSDHWACDAILACVEAGIVGGYADGSYDPEGTVDRGQMAVFVSRALAGGDENVPDPTTDPGFTDVNYTYWAYKHICYAVDQVIVSGYAEGDYRPDVDVDRGQISVFIARAHADGDANVPDGPAEGTFDDVPTDYWCYKYIEYCVAEEIVQGYSPTTYGPTGLVTRDQMAVFITRAFGLI